MGRLFDDFEDGDYRYPEEFEEDWDEAWDEEYMDEEDWDDLPCSEAEGYQDEDYSDEGDYE